MNKKIKYLLMTVGMLFLLIILPLAINNFIINNNYYSKATNDGWASFFGSYLGGILGGFGTLASVLITLRETRKENLKPFLVLDFDDTPKEIYYPEQYSEINKNDNIVNFYEIPHISKLFDISIRNTGKGYAKNIKITMLIKVEDALVTDKNLFWLNYIPLDMERISSSEDYYIQKQELTYIGSEGDKKVLPVNTSLNAILLCSIWNIDNFIQLTDEDFKQTRQYYNKKKKKNPLTIPNINIHIKYCDLDNNEYEEMYKIGFQFVYTVLGSHNLVKVKQDFNNELVFIKKDVQKSTKPRKKKKKKKIDRKTAQTISLRDEWCNKVYEYGISLGLSDDICKRICKDSGIKRYFYLCYQRERASIEQLIITIAVCIHDEVKINEFSRKKFITLSNKLRYDLLNIIACKDKKKYRRIINNKEQINYNEINDLPRLKGILKSEKEIFHNYFKSYEINDGKENQLIHIYSDSSNGVNIKVNVGNDDLKTELGFYRTGFSYRKIENRDDNLIVSVIQSLYLNEEIGFVDESGVYIEKQEQGWKCIYLR